MEKDSKETKTNPEATAGLVSKIFFWWLNPLFRIGNKRKYWDVEIQKATKELRPPSLTKCIIKCYWKPYGVLGIFTLIEEVIKVVQPVFLGKMIIYFETYDPEDMAALYESLGYAAGLSVCSIGLALLHHLYFYHVQRTGMKIRVAMCHMIYNKALCLSSSAMGKTTTGQIVNLLSNDVNKFDDAAVVVGLLWMEIGPSCLAGMVVLMILMPMQTMFGRLFSKFRKEISKIMKSSYLRGLNMASFFCASKIILFITFTLYVLLGNTITASRVFVTVSLYTAVRLTVTLFFPSAIEKLFESRVSIRRIQEFLMLDEIIKSPAAPPQEENKDASVEMQDLVCYWDKSLDAPSLQNLSFSLNSNKLLAVIGPVGAGKGTLKVKGQLTYAAQQPWVFPGTIRSNILFGKELEPQKYERVLRACALKRDMELLPDGDLTLIGDRGATLSGDRKLESTWPGCRHLPADDPLSAVDAEVGRHLFEKCICGLLKNKLRILVTHQLQYLQAADQIIVLKEGHMVAKGTYAELQRSGVDFTSLLQQEEEEEQQQAPQEVSVRKRTLSQNSALSQASSVHSVKDVDHLPAEAVHMVAEESRAQGNIGAGLYVKYMRAGASAVLLIFLILVNILAQVRREGQRRHHQVAYVMQDWWLAHW
ncbi:hypothetical protein F7725_009229 [Dissostichus mawsoni]|uniref:Multidrug resistance-associated protein 4-like n=1 Tax=Dissostichus mawsoni TaxID=36200 RepID=A0A7J5Z703_DISMA|nr:hypothetical protein F7725_009229 [Dissostichus mawsoni]